MTAFSFKSTVEKEKAVLKDHNLKGVLGDEHIKFQTKLINWDPSLRWTHVPPSRCVGDPAV
jgi:hypothetical protein